MRFHIAPLLAVSLLSACAVTPKEEDASSSSAALTGGVVTNRPIVFIALTRNNVLFTCTGTVISDSYVLTTQGCVDTTVQPSNVSVHTLPYLHGQFSDVLNIVSVATPGTAAFGVLLELATPIILPSYPAIARTPIGPGATMTCASTYNGDEMFPGVEAPFMVTEAFHPTLGYWGLAPTSAATFGGDYGDGCFQGNTLVGLEGYPESSGSLAGMQDVSFLAPAIDAVFCGGRTCGTVAEGSTTISCGTCGMGQTCVAGSCELKCPIGKVDCGGYCGYPKTCG